MVMWNLAALMMVGGAVQPSEPPPLSSNYERLGQCPAVTLDAAAACLIDTLGVEEVRHIRTDEGFRFEVYQAISLAWKLNDPNSPLSKSLASDNLYSPELSPAVIITVAKAQQDRKSVDLTGLKTAIAQVNDEQANRRANWKPNLPAGMSQVGMEQCPDLPAKKHPKAMCFRDADGKAIIVTPLPTTEGGL